MTEPKADEKVVVTVALSKEAYGKLTIRAKKNERSVAGQIRAELKAQDEKEN